jgi:hypothetical protein
MPRYPCPGCGRPSFSLRQKLSLGPLRKIRCKHCGAMVSVPWSAAYWFNLVFATNVGLVLPMVAGYLAWERYGGVAGLAVFVLGTLLLLWFTAWWHLRFVPLILKDAAPPKP